MRTLPTIDPPFGNARAADLVETILVPRTRDLGGGLTVGRVLPSAHRQMVGPFILLDNMAPANILLTEEFDVRRTRISVSLRSPTSIPAKSCIVIRSAACRRSCPAR